MISPAAERETPVTRRRGIGRAIAAFALYILGGLCTCGGFALILLMKNRDLWRLGEGRAVGYLVVGAGLALSVAGVILMRVFRNRGVV